MGGLYHGHLEPRNVTQAEDGTRLLSLTSVIVYMHHCNTQDCLGIRITFSRELRLSLT